MTSAWAQLRESQRLAVNADAHAGLAVTYDIGDRYDIHPTQKLIVAERLLRHARHDLYGETLVTEGPTPARVLREDGDLIIEFANAPLVLYGGARPLGFEVCNAERQCQYTDAVIDGARAYVDTRPSTIDAAFVRFCWADSPICNVYNEADLPAVPFEVAIPAR